MKKHFPMMLCIILAAVLLLTPVSSLAAEERESTCYDQVTYLMKFLCSEESDTYYMADPFSFFRLLMGYGGSRRTETQPEPEIAELNGFAEEVLILVNKARADEGLAPLAADPFLTMGAEIRTEEIIEQFSHTRTDGTSCFTALDEVGASYRKAGENIAIGQTSPKQVVEEWLASPGHRANIMDADFSRIGIAVTESTNSEYDGYAWAQFFAD